MSLRVDCQVQACLWAGLQSDTHSIVGMYNHNLKLAGRHVRYHNCDRMPLLAHRSRPVLQENRKEARSVLLRILQIGAAVGVTVGIAAFASKSLVSGVFTKDPSVSQQVQRVMPLVALFMVSHTISVLCIMFVLDERLCSVHINCPRLKDGNASCAMVSVPLTRHCYR